MSSNVTIHLQRGAVALAAAVRPVAAQQANGAKRQFSQTPPPEGPASEAAKALQSMRAGLFLGVQPPGIVYISGGSQGTVLLHAAEKNKGKNEGTEFVGLARNPTKAKAAAFVQEGDVKHQLDVEFTDKVAAPDGPNQKVTVLLTTPSKGVNTFLASMPKGVNVAGSYNGVPPKHDAEGHVVSMLATQDAPDGVGFTYAPKGFLQVQQDSPFWDPLSTAMQGSGVVDIQAVPDAKVAQWSKVALNTALNSLATFYGTTLGGLKEMMATDPRVALHMDGVIQEVCRFAQVESDVKLDANAIKAKCVALMGSSSAHPTSMGTAFKRGQALEVDVLSGAIGWDATAYPLCALSTTGIRQLEALRGEGREAPSDFEARVAEKLPGLREGLLAQVPHLNIVPLGV
jgi:hypothetical protein